MKLDAYLSKYKNKLNDLQTNFLLNVFFEDFGENGLDYIVPEFEIPKPDGSGVYKIDFVITTTYAKYAIECDGLYYHAEGAVTKDYFDYLQEKQNEIVIQGFRLIRFTNNLIRTKPEECIYDLRRSFIADEELFKIYLNRMGKIEPHEVQIEALNSLNETRKDGKKKGIVILATGLGKTYLSAFDVKQVNPKRILFIVHVNEILKQSMKSFQDVLTDRIKQMGFYVGSTKDSDKNILFASIQTLSRERNLRIFKDSDFDYIIVDETHHTAAPTYKNIFSYFKPKFILGLTATPERMDRKDILHYYDNNVVFEMDQEEAIKKGYLVPFHYYGFKDDVDYSEIYFNGFRYDVEDLNKLLIIEKRDEAIIKKFKELAPNRKTIGFCVSTEHADWCAEQFRKAGISAISIHSNLDESDETIDTKDRDKLIENFRKNKYQVAFVINMFNEGVDFTDVECLLFLRPTESKAIFIQHMGRGLRIHPKKENVIVLDFVGNYRTAGLILSGLGLKNGIKDLKKIRKGEKIIYFYDNNGCIVEFEEEVVDVFKMLNAKFSEKADMSLISNEWKEYGEYLQENTREGSNLYWKIGNKNNHIEVHLWALDFISNKLGKVSSDRLSTLLREESKKEFPGKTMEGTRALFFSKILGLIEDSPLKLTEAYKYMKSGKVDKLDFISNQFEKFYFWNDIFSLTDRHLEKGHKRPINKLFHLYPLFFIYETMISLKEKYGYNPSIIKFEFEAFLSVARAHTDIDEVLERIVSFREHEEKYQIEKYLKEKNEMDDRLYSALKFCKYFNWQDNQISIKEELYEELKKKVEIFKQLIEKNLLIEFEEKKPKKYYKMLYSKKDLLKYHK